MKHSIRIHGFACFSPLPLFPSLYLASLPCLGLFSPIISWRKRRWAEYRESIDNSQTQKDTQTAGVGTAVVMFRTVILNSVLSYPGLHPFVSRANEINLEMFTTPGVGWKKEILNWKYETCHLELHQPRAPGKVTSALVVSAHLQWP